MMIFSIYSTINERRLDGNGGIVEFLITIVTKTIVGVQSRFFIIPSIDIAFLYIFMVKYLAEDSGSSCLFGHPYILLYVVRLCSDLGGQAKAPAFCFMGLRPMLWISSAKPHFHFSTYSTILLGIIFLAYPICGYWMEMVEWWNYPIIHLTSIIVQ